VGDDGLQELVDLFGGGEFVGNRHRAALSYQPSAWPICIGDRYFFPLRSRTTQSEILRNARSPKVPG
jgi:hypothetical protein